MFNAKSLIFIALYVNVCCNHAGEFLSPLDSVNDSLFYHGVQFLTSYLSFIELDAFLFFGFSTKNISLEFIFRTVVLQDLELLGGVFSTVYHTQRGICTVPLQDINKFVLVVFIAFLWGTCRRIGFSFLSFRPLALLLYALRCLVWEGAMSPSYINSYTSMSSKIF